MKIPRAVVALPVTLILGLTLGGTALADPPSPPGTKASAVGQGHRSEQAQETLAEVQALVEGKTGAHRGRTSDGRDLTLALRDLRLQLDALPAADKQVAERYFLRPGTGGDPYIPGALPINKCSGEICVHYTETGDNAVDGSDGNADTIPAYVTLVQSTINQINIDYVAAGYRTPVRDGSLGGGTNKIDIYLGNIGTQGLYGFCTTDDPKADDPNATTYDVWAYCALDNDYDQSEFPTNTPTENMQVTAAHEFFHAVQYAYDWADDGWLLESTATWVEDEMFDAVNDNRNYLPNSPITSPGTPVDYFGDGFHYGTWIFWRYLTEKFPAKTGKLPKLVLDVWKKLDGAAGGPDKYSTQGLSQVLESRGTTLRKELQLFFAANRHPKTAYDEGASYPTTQAAKVGFGRAQSKGFFCKPLHMAACFLQATPNNLGQSDWKLKLKFDAPPTARGGAFVVSVYKKSGRIITSIVKLTSTGAGAKTVPFSSGSIAKVDVIWVNTSARFNCFVPPYDSPYSCLGVPKDDSLRSDVVLKAFRS